MKNSGVQPDTLFYKRSKNICPGLTCIDLFSGAGGLAEGFRQAGWSILSANDIDVGSGETFRLNFPEASFFESPISSVNGKALLKDAGLKRGQLDCLIGGPPCQSFSYNNHQRSATDARADLFRDYLRIVADLNPKILLMENVPGILTIGEGSILSEIERGLSSLGYETNIKLLYAEDYGVPQARRRVFIVASRIGSVEDVFPNGTHGPAHKPSVKGSPYIYRWEPRKGSKPKKLTTVWDAISDLPLIKNGGGKSRSLYRCAARSEFQKSVRACSKHVENHFCINLTDRSLERISWVPEGGNWRDIPRPLLPAGMLRADLNCHTKRYGRLSRKGLASTILTKCDPHWGAYVHPTQNRTISVREAARLQGFPDSFRFFSDKIFRHHIQIGNAVPVPLARALGKALTKHLKKHSSKAISIKRNSEIVTEKRAA